MKRGTVMSRRERRSAKARGVPTVLYHRTTNAAAQEILRAGFRDATGTYMTTSLHTGVWLSDMPLDINEGAGSGEPDDVLLRVDLTVDVTSFEWIQDIGYREFLVPADLINGHSTVRVVGEDEEEDLIRARWRARGWTGPTRTF
jgi:hypothetical protein